MPKKHKIQISAVFTFKNTGPRTFQLSNLTCEYKDKDNKIKSVTIPCDITDQEQWASSGKLYIETKAMIPGHTVKPWKLDKIQKITAITLIDNALKDRQTQIKPNAVSYICFHVRSKHIRKKFLDPKYKINKQVNQASPFDYEIPGKKFHTGINIHKKKYRYEILCGSRKNKLLKNTDIKIKR